MARNHYSPDLIACLVKQVIVEERPLTHVARAEGIHPGVLSKWVKREREDCKPVAVTPGPDHELDLLRDRIRTLEERQEVMRGLLEKLLRSRYQ